tara:strand:- start:225 stop:656 length:432 start_codon:yes stop_codon:yes gene_type:complete
VEKIGIKLFLVFIVLFFLYVPTEGKDRKLYSRQLDSFPSYSWGKINEEGKLTGYRGFNALLGYYSKNYILPLKTNTFNFFWELNTIMLVLPHIGIGTEYIWKNGFYLNISYIYGAIGLGLFPTNKKLRILWGGTPAISFGIKF